MSLTALWLEIAITLEMLYDRLLLSAERKGAKFAVRACSALLVSLLADSIVSLAQPDCAPKLVNYSRGSNWLIDGGWRARSKKNSELKSEVLFCIAGGALSGVQRSAKSVTFSWAVSRSQIVL